MPRYDYVLFDADNTLFDFDRAEAEALRTTLAEYGLPATPETEETYLAVNRALWAQFDRGEVSRSGLPGCSAPWAAPATPPPSTTPT